MFSSSVRRAAFSTPPTPIAALSTCCPRAAVSQAAAYRRHQRRFSSSKPSSPADGSKGITDGRAVPENPSKAEKVVKAAESAPKSAEKTTTRKRKAKDVAAESTVKGRDESLLHLPSVPSTQHISEKEICLSDFFSLHRPISMTKSLPKTVTDESFASIFTPRTRSNKPSDVISTLTNITKKLDAVTGKLGAVKLTTEQEQWNQEVDDIRHGITADSYRKAETQHLDGAPQAAEDWTQHMAFPAQVLSGKHRPFNVPPPPVPMNTAESLAAGLEAASEAETLEPQHRTYTAVLTVEESTDMNGEVTYLAHASPLVAELPPAQPPTKFLERMQIRRQNYLEQRAEENDMLAISVKRQRKLKMKKHKYKKLMRRTRNLRRRLDRN